MKPSLSIDTYIQSVLSKKAMNALVMDVTGLTSIADFFIICSGRSGRQVNAIAEYVRTDLKKQGIYPLGTEGITEGHWALLDYGHVIIHIFYEPIRTFYDLEGLWGDAKRIDTSGFVIPDTEEKDKIETEEDEEDEEENDE